jgi:DNA-binding CsgD family transcriptional regulator
MPKFDEGRLGSVVDRLYEAAARPELWRSVLHETSAVCGGDGAMWRSVLHETGAICGAGGPSLTARPASIGVIWSEGIDEAVETMIRTGWHLRNERMLRAVAFIQNGRQIITESDQFTQAELDRHPFNAEFVNPNGFRWYVALPVAEDAGHTVLSIERRWNREPFSKMELARIRTLVPHLRRAGHFALKFGLARSEGMLDAFEQLDCGALLLSVAGHVIRLNKAATIQIGRCINLVDGSLRAAHKGADGALQRLVASVLVRGPAHESPAHGPVALPRPEGRGVVAYAAPIVASAGDVFQRAKAIVMLVDPDKQRTPGEMLLRGAFGLTAAESRLVLCLHRGVDLQAAAAELNISYETARTMLKRVFSKVGISRQSELVALLTRMTLPSKRHSNM